MYKANSSVMNYLNPSKGGLNKKKSAKDILKIIWKWTKIVGFLFIIISMIWGCVQMYQSNYSVNKVTDMMGNQVFAPGTAFEIVIRSLGESGGKSHIIGGAGLGLSEYNYNGINSWGEAFSKTGSPFYGFFVYPIAFLLAAILKGFSGTLNPGLDSHSQLIYGVSTFFAIFFTVLIVRSITLAFTWKSQVNQEKMQMLQLKQAEIQAKYKDRKDMQSKQKQQAEIMALYKKEGLSQMSAITGSFASLPFLFAIYAIIRSTRALKIANIGAISLIEGPWEKITKGGEPIYLVLLAVYLPLQVLSMFLPTILQYIKTKGTTLTEAQKKSRKRNLIMQIVMVVMFIFVVASVSSGVAIYWILSSLYQICQVLAFHFYNARKAKPGSRERERRLRQIQAKTKR